MGQFIVLTVLDILILVYVETALKKRLIFYIINEGTQIEFWCWSKRAHLADGQGWH